MKTMALALVTLFCAETAIACGDKFLVPSRSPQAIASLSDLEPGRILIYRNPDSEVATTVMDSRLKDTLERVGHRVEVVSSPDELRAALETGVFDIVLADLGDVERMVAPERSPVLLPVVYKANWTEVTRLKEAYRCVLNAPSRISQMLSVIEEAVKLSRTAAG